MDLKDMKNKSPAELAEHLDELRKEQFNLRMQRGTGQLTQTHQLRNVRREIARAKTLITAKTKAAP
jgi:large subunit ribosomal protein L29